MTAARSGLGSATTGWWALRLVLATAAVLVAAHFLAARAVAALLPLLGAVLRYAADDFAILELGLVTERGNASIAALARLEHVVVLGGRAIVPDGSIAVVGTTIGAVLQPILVAACLVLAWPARGLEMLLRIAVVSVLLAIVVLIDTPLCMAAWLWLGLLKAHEPSAGSPLVWWSGFLVGGGRLALGLVAAALAIALAAPAARRIGAGAAGARTGSGPG